MSQFYDLSAFDNFLVSIGTGANIRRSYLVNAEKWLIAYRVPPGEPPVNFLGDGGANLREILRDATPRQQAAWKAWAAWAAACRVQLPAGAADVLLPAASPLAAFTTWLTLKGAAPSTATLYTTRINALYRATGWTDAPPPGDAVDVGAQLDAYLGTLQTSAFTSTVSAWRAFVAWAHVRGVTLPEPRRQARGRIGSAPSGSFATPQLPVPLEVASAIYQILSTCPKLEPEVAVALTWQTYQSGKDGVTILDPRAPRAAGWTWPRAQSYAWEVVRKHAAGSAPRPAHTGYILTVEPGGAAPFPLPVLHSIRSMGEHRMLPVLMPPLSVGSGPPPLPTAAGPLPAAGPPPFKVS